MLKKTLYYFDFIEYYMKAKKLQQRNLGLLPEHTKVDDPLMDNITIYDTVNRRYAGFSNMLEDLWYGSKSPKNPSPQFDDLRDKWDEKLWLYIFLVHRTTGSGASFSKDHGYRNTCLPQLAKMDNFYGMKNYIYYYDRPIFTSIGNQIPPFNKPDVRYQTGGKMYLCEVAPVIVDKFLSWIRGRNTVTIQEGVDKICAIQKREGWKQFHFVLTAFIMDLAEYYPEHVDPDSMCYYGKNAKECMDLLFREPKNYDEKMMVLCNHLGARPYDLEDVLCDYIRYVENYIPKGYEHLRADQVKNNSAMRNHPKHQSWQKIATRS